MSLIPGATLTLPGIAGIVLTVGMAVDANVLIFERIKEEIRNGSTPIASIELGYKKAFSTIADANITTLIASIILFIFGTGPIKGFAVTLSIGVISSMFTAIIVTRILAEIIYENQNLNKKIKYMKHININFNFMKWHKKAVYISLTLIFISIFSIFTKGLNYGVDFNGGTIIEIGFKDKAPIEDIRKFLKENKYEKSSVQFFGSNKDILIRMPNILSSSEATLSNTLLGELNKKYTFDLKRVEYVGAQVGEELRDQGILAALIALALITIYIALRFEYRFSIGAILALIHDVFNNQNFSITQIEFNLSVFAAILAVIGYSLNDTIVVFDRIRENFKSSIMENVDTILN